MESYVRADPKIRVVRIKKNAPGAFLWRMVSLTAVPFVAWAQGTRDARKIFREEVQLLGIKYGQIPKTPYVLGYSVGSQSSTRAQTVSEARKVAVPRGCMSTAKQMFCQFS